VHRDVASRLEDAIEGAAIHDEVAQQREGGGAPRLDRDALPVLVALVPESPELAPCVWETGIDVYRVERVAVDPDESRIAVEAREHVRDAAGAIVEQSVTYTIAYEVDPESGEIARELSVERSGDPAASAKR
jgi:hypothetical protein